MPETEDDAAHPDLNVGIAEVRPAERHVTIAERKRWQAEDAERDARRIPLGLRATTSRAKMGGRKPGTWPKVPRFDRRG